MSTVTFDPQVHQINQSFVVDEPITFDLERVRVFDIFVDDGDVAIEGVDLKDQVSESIPLPIRRSKREWKQLTITGNGTITFKGIVR